jgi:tRNA threonylcarbamoyl adenosine modification protein YjeE
MLSALIPPLFSCLHRVSLPETQLPTLATALMQAVKPNTVISIEGGLGAGKTTLIRAVGHAMGIKTRMTSPTYVYFNQYSLVPNPTGVTQVLHVDFYRLSEAENTTNSTWLVEELLELQAQAPTLILAEWASIVAHTFQSLITHQLQITPSSCLTDDDTLKNERRCYQWFSQQRLLL